MNISETQKKWLWLCFALIVPFSIFIPWVVADHSYPFNDASEYLEQAWKHYVSFKQEGWFRGLTEIYTQRHWRPVVFVDFGAIAMLLTGGHVSESVHLVYYCFYALLILSFYQFFLLFLSPARSSLATVAVALLPWVFAGAHCYSNESAVLIVGVAALSWMLRVRRLDQAPRSGAIVLGLCFGLALCFKPADILLAFFVPVSVWLGLNLKEDRISIRDLGIWSLAYTPLLATFAFLPKVGPRWEASPHLWTLTWIVPLPFVIFGFRKRLRLQENFSWVAFCTFLIAGIWFAPYCDSLRRWIFAGSGGEMGDAEKAAAASFSFVFLYKFILYMGGLHLLALGVGWVMSVFSKGGLKRTQPYLIFGLLCVLVPLGLELLTYSSSVRYFYVESFILYALVLVAVLAPEGKWQAARAAVVVVTIAASWTWAYRASNHSWVPNLLSLDPSAEFYSVYPLNRDPALETVLTLERILPRGKKLKILDMVHYFNDYGAAIVTASKNRTTPILAQERGDDWDFADKLKEPGIDYLTLTVTRTYKDLMVKAALAVYPDWVVMAEVPFHYDEQSDVVQVVFDKPASLKL